MRRRKHDRSEEIGARLEENLRVHFDDPRAIRSYGEWLKARGDPHGELIIQALRAEVFEAQDKRSFRPLCRARRTAKRFIDAHWYEWFEGVEREEVDFTWAHGFVRRAWIGRGAGVGSLPRLLGAPPMRFLEALDVGDFTGRVRGLLFLPRVKELVVPVVAALDPHLNFRSLGEGLTLKGSLRELRTWRDR